MGTTNLLMRELPYFRITDKSLLELYCRPTQVGVTCDNDLHNYLKSIAGDDYLGQMGCEYYSTKRLNKLYSKVVENNDLSLIHLNIHSLNANYGGLLLLLSQFNFKFDVIVLSEIWSYNINFLEGIMEGYDFYYDLPVNSKVGGVGIYIKNEYNCSTRDDLKLKVITAASQQDVENVWLEFEKNDKQYIIAGIYRHPGMDYKCFADRMERLLQQIPGNKKKLTCIIAGDFNIDLCKYNTDKTVGEYLNNLLTNNFQPMIIMPTRITQTSSTIIDHIYVRNECNRSSAIGGNIFADVSDHLPNFVLINDNKKVHQKKDKTMIRLFTEKNKIKFKAGIHAIKWNDLFQDEKNANALYNIFSDEVEKKFNESFPLVKKSRRGMRDKEWITKGIKISSKHKNKLYKCWIKEKKECDLLKYKNYKKVFEKAARKLETDYYHKVLDTKFNGMKRVWRELNKLGKVSSGKNDSKIITKLKVNGSELVTSEDISNAFNNYFCNVAKNIVDGMPKSRQNVSKYMPNPVSNSIFMKPTDTDELSQLIKSLNPHKAAGHDEMCAQLIQETSCDIVTPLVYIYNNSLDQGIVPDRLKLAKVVPIYKKEDRCMLKNYRPISLLSNFDKLLEKIVYKRLLNFLNKEKILYEYQFGFRAFHSTSLALIDVVDNIYEELDRGNFVMGVFLDLQKAFDTVDHCILLEKLEFYGIRGVAKMWLMSYLKNRTQYVKVGNSKSGIKSIEYGVPQGSVLGPLLFLIYVNDMARAVPDSKIKLFADDTNIFLSGNNLQLLSNKMNDELEKLASWMIANKLCINYEKTYFSVYKPRARIKNDKSTDDTERDTQIMINEVHIKLVKNCKYLGVIIDDQLNWKEQINHVILKITKFTCLFYKFRKLLPMGTLRMLYFSLVHPHIQYGIELYANTCESYLDRLNKINNKIIRIIQNFSLDTPLRLLYSSFNALPLMSLFKFNIGVIVYKALNSKCECPDVYREYFQANSSIHSHNTRHCTDLHQNAINSSYGYKTVREMGPRLWNKIPVSIQQCKTLAKFRKKLKEHYLKEEFGISSVVEAAGIV